MELTDRQEKLLNALVKEYIDTGSAISSDLLKKRCALDVSPATVRNDLQQLAESGYITQPHTSAGRLPTNKAYRYVVNQWYGKTAADEQQDTLEEIIFREMKKAHQRIEEELRLAKELTSSLTEISITFSRHTIGKKDNLLEILEMLGPSKSTYDKNIELINKLLEELESF